MPKILRAVSVTAVLKVVIIEFMSVSSLLMMVRGANLPPVIAWEVSNTLGSFCFSRSNLSLVCFGSLISFQAKAEGHHQQVVITSNVCFWKTSCSGNVHSLRGEHWTKCTPGVNFLFALRTSSTCVSGNLLSACLSEVIKPLACLDSS